MNSVSTIVGLYLALIAMMVIGLAIAGKIGDFASSFTYLADKYIDRFREASNPPLMSLVLNGSSLYLNITPLTPFYLKYLIMEFSNGSSDITEMDLLIRSPTLILLMQNYSGEVFRPILVTDNGISYVYTPARDVNLVLLNPAIGGKSYIDSDVVNTLAEQGIKKGSVTSVYNPLLNSPMLVIAGDTMPSYSLARVNNTLRLDLSLGFTILSNGSSCLTVNIYNYQTKLYLYCLDSSSNYFDNATRITSLTVINHTIDLYIEGFGSYKGVVYYWYPYLTSREPSHIFNLYILLRFKPRDTVSIVLNGTASVNLSFNSPGAFIYSPYPNVCDTVLDDYFGLSVVIPMIQAPYSNYVSKGYFEGYVNATNIYGGFNQTRQYQFTNASYLLTQPDTSLPYPRYPPIYNASSTGYFATSDYVIIAGGGTYLARVLPETVTINASINIDSLIVLDYPYVTISTQQSGLLNLSSVFQYVYPNPVNRTWYKMYNDLLNNYTAPQSLAYTGPDNNLRIVLDTGGSSVYYTPTGYMNITRTNILLPVLSTWNISCTGSSANFTLGNRIWFNIVGVSANLSSPSIPQPLLLSLNTGLNTTIILVEPAKPIVTIGYYGSNQSVYAFVYRGVRTILYNTLNETLEAYLVKLTMTKNMLVYDTSTTPVDRFTMYPGINYWIPPSSIDRGFYALLVKPVDNPLITPKYQVIIVYII
ncbi:hypothetical protein ACSU1N_02085 [Thermogladius sp. 4427co]|uniref:hypothetical protein n=1 Tax=Thermogladius sp. 4427co TaxID=3450718 RepID=UPI003F7AF81C